MFTEQNPAPAQSSAEDLIDRKEAKRLLCLRGKTNHTLRRMELRGQLIPVVLTSRLIRYKRSDVLRLIDVLAVNLAA